MSVMISLSLSSPFSDVVKLSSILSVSISFWSLEYAVTSL